MDKRYQVFISSTFADLQEERSKVIQTIMELDCIPAGMEIFPAIDEEQFEFIKKVIDDCDYYLLIIGGRYGSISDDGLSYTEKEYDYAIQKGLKVIAFIHANPDLIPLGKSEKDETLKQKLQSFREKASTNRLVKFWKAADELPGLVALSLAKTIKTYPAIGWIRADKAMTPDIYKELEKLRNENLILKNKSALNQLKVEGEKITQRIARILKLWRAQLRSFDNSNWEDNMGKTYYISEADGNFKFYFAQDDLNNYYCLIISIHNNSFSLEQDLADIRVMLTKYNHIADAYFRFVIAVGCNNLSKEKEHTKLFFDNAMKISKIKPKKKYSVELWDESDVFNLEKEFGIKF